MRFLHTIKKSVYDTDFYNVAKTESSGVAMKYYTLLVLLMACVATIPIVLTFQAWLHSHPEETENIRSEMLLAYPDELILDFKNGQVLSNVAEPYSISMPTAFIDEKGPKNLIVINTRGSIDPTDFVRYNTVAILGNDALWTYNSQENKIEIQKLDRFSKESIVINKQKATEWVNIVFNIGKKIALTVIILLPLIIFAFSWFKYLFYLLFGAIVILLIAKARKTSLAYGQAYKLGLYLITLPILYDTLTVGPLSILKIPFGFTLILIIVTYINLASMKSDDSSTGTLEGNSENGEMKSIVPMPNVQIAENITEAPKDAERERGQVPFSHAN